MRLHAAAGVVLMLFQMQAERPATAKSIGSIGQEFPFELRDGLIWVQVQVPQTSDKLNFLLDTGAGVSVLNRATAARLGLHQGNKVTVEGVGASLSGLWPQPLWAKAGEVSLPCDYVTVDLSRLSGACTTPIDGLIGADFFQDKIVTIDFVEQRVKVLKAVPSGETWETLPMKSHHGAFLVPLSVNARPPEWFRVDTGCASWLQWVTTRRVAADHPKRLAVALSSLPIEQTETAVRLGNTVFNAVPTGAHTRAIFSREAGLLGNGLLSQLKGLTIDTRSGHLLLQAKRAGEGAPTP